MTRRLQTGLCRVPACGCRLLVALVVALTGLLLPGTVLARSGAHRMSGAASDAQSFQVPWSGWPSDTADQKGQTMTPADADNGDKNPFADNTFHRQLYQRHGMQAGYLQQAHVALNPSGDEFKIWWLGSYYASEADAASRVNDAAHTLGAQGFTGQSCFLDDQPNCHLFISLNLVYAVWSTQNGVAELLFNFDLSSMAHGQNRLGHDFQKLLMAADATLLAAVGSSATPTLSASSTPVPQPTIGINDVTIYHDVNGTLKKTKAVRIRDLVAFVVTLHVSNFGTYSPSGDIKISFPKGRMQVIKAVIPTDLHPETTKVIYDGPVDLQGQLGDGTFYAASIGTFEGVTAVGPLTGQISINLDAASDSRTIQFTLQEALPQCKKGYTIKGGSCVKKRK